MTSNDNAQRQADGPEAGATEEAVALHGDQAREEQQPQPETVALDTDTLIATSDERSGDEADDTHIR